MKKVKIKKKSPDQEKVTLSFMLFFWSLDLDLKGCSKLSNPRLQSDSLIYQSPSWLRISPTNIETISLSIFFPFIDSSFFISPFRVRTSKHAAHSNAEPLALQKYRHRSFTVDFPFPSAILRGIDVEALSNWSRDAIRQEISTSSSSENPTKSRDS